jgi:hypothetical protein
MTFSYELSRSSLHFVKNHPAKFPHPGIRISVSLAGAAVKAVLRRSQCLLVIDELLAFYLTRYGVKPRRSICEETWEETFRISCVTPSDS